MSCNQPDLFVIPQKPNTLPPEERKRLVASVIPMCRKYAADRFSRIESQAGNRVSLEDLEAECYLAAVHAAEKHDKDRGNAFSTTCYSFLKTHIFGYLQNMWVQDAGKQHVGFDDSRDNGQSAEESDGDPDTLPPDCEEGLLLANLTGEAREVVRLMVFEELSPEQVAIQMGKAVKDVRLIARNAAKHLTGVKARTGGANLFNMPNVETPGNENV